MRLKFYYFSIFLFLAVVAVVSFSATTYNSESGSLSPPSLTFKSWRAGRGSLNSSTFISSTETECWVEASVGYTGNLPRETTAPIDPSTVRWEFIEKSNGMTLAEAPGTSWSGNHPSKLSGSTAFNILAKLSLPAHDNRTYYTVTQSCTTDANRQSRTAKHRGGKPLTFTIKFTANTTQGHPLEVKKKFKQDEIDQMRQEYLDLSRQIPGRGTFKNADGDFNNFGRVFYDFGHYTKMLYEGLKDKHGAWTTKINELYRRGKPAFTRADLFVTSGYRNPHHNDYHARELTRRATTKKHGLHQYGLALDIRGRDIDDVAGKDPQKMIEAAKAAAAKWWDVYDTGHVHADWRGSGWPPSNPIPLAPTFTLPTQSTDAPLVAAPPNNQPPPTNSPPTGSGCANNPTYNYCTDTGSCTTRSPSGVPGECGHNYCCCAPPGSPMYSGDTPGSSNPGGTSPPAPSTVSCVRRTCTIAVSTPGEHRVQCDAGHTYMSCNTGSYNLHRTRTCRRSACRQTWQRCTSRAPSCLAYSGRSCFAE